MLDDIIDNVVIKFIALGGFQVMFYLLSWAIYGIIVGGIAKLIHTGEDPEGWLTTIAIGVAGSYIGGFIAYMIGFEQTLQSGGLLFGIIGAVVLLFAIRKMANK